MRFGSTILRAQAYIRYSNVYCRLLCARLLRRRVLILAGTPSHQNIGDRAISVAERQFIKSISKGFITVELRLQTNSLINKIIPPSLVRITDVFILHGGGNFGDRYQEDIEFRMAIIENFINNKIILMPQTINFTKGADSREFVKHRKIFGSAKNLALCAREQKSFELMKTHFPNNKIMLLPDIVLYLNRINSSNDRSGVILLMRNDIEKSIDSDDIKNILRYTEDVEKNKIIFSDTVAKLNIFLSSILPDTLIVSNKLRQVSKFKLVVTDRLHGMIFAAITGTPVVAFSNNDWKVKGVYSWLKEYKYIQYCDSVSELPTALLRVMEADNRDFNSDKFSEQWRDLQNIIIKSDYEK